MEGECNTHGNMLVQALDNSKKLVPIAKALGKKGDYENGYYCPGCGVEVPGHWRLPGPHDLGSTGDALR